MLGQHYDSASPERGIVKDWTNSPLRVVWSREIGVGYGNGVVSQGRFFQFDRYADLERLTCHHAETGDVLWEHASAVSYRDAYGYNDGPRCSPVVAGELVITYGVTGQLTCRSVFDGREIWTRNLNKEFWVVPNFFGVGSTPMVYDGLVWVMVGGSPPTSRPYDSLTINDVPTAKPNGCGMVALDILTGETKHQTGNYLASYAAPIIKQIGNQEVAIAFMREGLLTFDPQDGSRESFLPWRATSLESVNAGIPVVLDNRILVGEAYERGGMLVELNEGSLQRVWEDSPARRNQQFRPHWTNPIAVGEVLYVSSGRNQPDTDFRAIALRATERGAELETLWAVRNRDRMTGIFVDGHLVMLGERGNLQLVRPSETKMDVVAQMDLLELDLNSNELDRASLPLNERPELQTPFWAPPILARGLLYIRAANRIVCLELIPE